MTIWKRIPVLPERFEASDDGRIHTLDHYTTYVTKNGTEITRLTKGRILTQRLGKPSIRGVKHAVVSIYKGSSREDSRNDETRVAFLVAAAFYGIPWTKPNDRHKWRIRFKDGNPLNCWAMNLEWVHSFGENGEAVNGQSLYERNLQSLAANKTTTSAWDESVKYYGVKESIAMFREDGMEDQIPAGVLAFAS